MSTAVEDEGLSNTEIKLETQQEVQDIFIFQCASCRVIVGDSTAWVCSSEKMNAIALHRVTDQVDVIEGRHISEEGYDHGCAFDILQCKQCKTTLGKMYVTTPRLLDNLREVFTFDIGQLQSYQVGSGEQQSPVGLEYCLSIPTALSLEVKFNKMKTVLMSLVERTDKIERELEFADEMPQDDVDIVEVEDEDDVHLEREGDENHIPADTSNRKERSRAEEDDVHPQDDGWGKSKVEKADNIRKSAEKTPPSKQAKKEMNTHSRSLKRKSAGGTSGKLPAKSATLTNQSHDENCIENFSDYSHDEERTSLQNGKLNNLNTVYSVERTKSSVENSWKNHDKLYVKEEDGPLKSRKRKKRDK